MNADGLYLVSYYALLLSLKLCCQDYYRRRPMPVLVSLVSGGCGVNVLAH